MLICACRVRIAARACARCCARRTVNTAAVCVTAKTAGRVPNVISRLEIAKFLIASNMGNASGARAFVIPDGRDFSVMSVSYRH